MSETERPPDESPAEPVEAPEEHPADTVVAGSEPRAGAWPGEDAPRRLERSRDDRVIAGVCGGLGEYLGVDAVLIRIAALLLVFAGGAGILLYVIGWVAMPEAAATPAVPGESVAAGSAPQPDERRTGAFVLGLVFVALGVFFLVDGAWPDFLSWKYVWPLALIAVGAAILLRPRR